MKEQNSRLEYYLCTCIFSISIQTWKWLKLSSTPWNNRRTSSNYCQQNVLLVPNADVFLPLSTLRIFGPSHLCPVSALKRVRTWHSHAHHVVLKSHLFGVCSMYRVFTLFTVCVEVLQRTSGSVSALPPLLRTHHRFYVWTRPLASLPYTTVTCL